MPGWRPLPARTAFALLLCLALVTWWPVATCGFIWDDDDYVTQNRVLRTGMGLWRLWTEPTSLPQYYPLVHTTFWLEYRLWGLSPLGYHVVNVALHTVSACLVWRLGRVLALPGALVAAAWFLAHPVHVESVAWITERKNVLSLACALAAALAWLRWREHGRRGAYATACAWFAAALLAKTVVVALPAALLVVIWWRDGRVVARDVRSLLPWLLVGLGFAWLTVHLETTHVAAADARWQLQSAERLLVAGRAPWSYLGSLLWPVGVCFNYPRWQLDTASVAAWAWPAATVAVLGLAWGLRGRCGRGPLASLLLFGGALVPALGFFDVYPFRYAFVADHFQYHASVAVLLAVPAWLLPRLARWSAPWQRAAEFAGAAALVALIGLTWHALGAYRDLDTLWRRVLLGNPDSTLAMTNLGGLANLRGDAAAAKPWFERALALDPTLHEAWCNLGVIAQQAGDRATARAHYERALQCKPNDAATHNNLAVLLLEEGHAREAIPHAERALDGHPDYFEAHLALGQALHDAGQWERALAEIDYVLQRMPQHLDSRRRAVRCLSRLGRHTQAASNAMVWLRAEPASAAARAEVVATMADALRGEAPASIRAAAEGALTRSGLDPGPILPALAAALRDRGAAAQADALAH